MAAEAPPPPSPPPGPPGDPSAPPGRKARPGGSRGRGAAAAAGPPATGPVAEPRAATAATTTGGPDDVLATPSPPAPTAPAARSDDAAPRRRDGPLLVDLALQGGGAHGAFTWGVLDRLLEERWFRIEAVSGTSAGAMNGAVFADGYAEGGPEGARAALERFWRAVSRAAVLSPLRRSPLDILLGRWSLDASPVFAAFDAFSRAFSPYDLNPGGANPLRAVLAETVDFARLARSPVKLFVAATNVRTGQGRVFANHEVTPDVLLASACLPFLFQAVELPDGEAYWDGGYSGNPTITPLVRECASDDTILVQINPVERPGVPRTAREIANRVNEVSFNATLLKELRMIAILRQVADTGDCEGAAWARMRVHRVASAAMTGLGYSSKLNAEWDFLLHLRDAGRREAEAFLRERGGDLGVRSGMDLDALL